MSQQSSPEQSLGDFGELSSMMLSLVKVRLQRMQKAMRRWWLLRSRTLGLDGLGLVETFRLRMTSEPPNDIVSFSESVLRERHAPLRT